MPHTLKQLFGKAKHPSVRSVGGGQCCIHTYSDWVDLSLYLQSAVVALEGINHLFELRLTDHKTLSTILVLLLVTLKSQQMSKLRHWKQGKTKTKPPWYLLNDRNVNSHTLPTYHFPFFAFQLQHWSAGWGSSGSCPGGWERFGSCVHRAYLRLQLRILVCLLVIRHMFQPWKCIKTDMGV